MVVLVAQMDFICKRLSIFVRLEQSLVLPDLPEIAVPTRFFFCVFGPTGTLPQSRDIGRAMATLFSDRVSTKKNNNKQVVQFAGLSRHALPHRQQGRAAHWR